jgi:tripartite-type tricarboxylate transporter receptor subunit TctC
MLAAEAIAKLANVDLINVTYKWAPQALSDILAGHTDLYVVDFGVGLPSIRSGKLRPLAMTSSRSPLLPEVPPLADTLPGFDLPPWNGIFGPANLPSPSPTSSPPRFMPCCRTRTRKKSSRRSAST